MMHPQTHALLDLIAKLAIPAINTLTPAQARENYRERRTATQPEPPAVASIDDLQAQGPHGPIPVRLYKPLPAGSEPLPVLVYFHGGGWVIGDLDTHDTLCRQLANASGCAVLAVDYRMGPEHRFPCAVDDCLAATRWCRDQAAALGLDRDRMAVGGDSAGGNLAAVVAIAARDAGDLPLRFQLLIYPATDMRRIAPSHSRNGQGYLLTSDAIAYFHDHYIDNPAHDTDWRASPLLCESLRDLPEALVLTAGYDPLCDEGLMYSQRLSEAGNRACHINFERQIHGFITMGRVIDEADAAVHLCAAQLSRALRLAP
ncbi:MAG: alpha/beta hydrolase [Burkholderiaceae bacterium]